MTAPGSGLPRSGRVADGGDVLRRHTVLREREEGGHGVLEAGRVRVLWGATVVEHEGGHTERLGEVARQLTVAGGRSDRKPATVGVEQNLGGVRAEGTAPDAGNAADGVLGVRDVGRLGRGLVPLVEDAAEQADGEDLGPVGVEVLQGVLAGFRD